MAVHFETIVDTVIEDGEVTARNVVNHLVRCKDCKYADDYNHCDNVMWHNGPDDFCSRGERKIR